MEEAKKRRLVFGFVGKCEGKTHFHAIVSECGRWRGTLAPTPGGIAHLGFGTSQWDPKAAQNGSRRARGQEIIAITHSDV